MEVELYNFYFGPGLNATVRVMIIAHSLSYRNFYKRKYIKNRI